MTKRETRATTKSISQSISRRSFLKTTGAAAAMLSLGGGVSLASFKAIGPAKAAKAAGQERTAIAGCQFAGCFSCQAKVIVRDGKIVNIMTDPNEVRGLRPCLRGRSQINRIYGHQRVQYPLRRVGKRGENKWERISWDEAIEEIANKWKGYAKEFGAASIIMDGSGSKGGGYIQSSLLVRLKNIMGWTESAPCDDFAMAKGLNKVFGPAANTWGFPPFQIEHLKWSKAMITWSGNLSVAATQDWKHIMDNQARGMKFVVVDPNYTVSAQKADLWVRPKPGTDTVLIFTLINYIIEHKLINQKFAAAHTVAPVLIRQDTGKYLRMSDLGTPPSTGPVDPMTGMPSVINPPVQWDLATNTAVPLETAAQPTLTVTDPSGFYTVGGFKCRTAYDMLVDVVKEYSLEAGSQFTEVPVDTIIELAKIVSDTPVYNHVGYGSQSYNNGVQNGHALGTMAALLGNVGIPGAGNGNGWHGPVYNLAYTYPTGFMNSLAVPKLALYEIAETGKMRGADFPIKSLYLVGSNIVGGSVDTNRIVNNYIGKVEFVVCQDNVFSDTARQADILLPASHYFEVSDVFSAGVYTLYNEAAIDPLYESKPDGEIAKLLGKALGVGQYFNKSDEEYLNEALDSADMKRLNLTLDNLKEKHAMRFMAENYIPNADGVFPTSTGRLEFYVDEPTPRVDYGQSFDKNAERLPRWFAPTEAWSDNTDMAKYPLVFMSERARARYHTQNYESEWLLELESEPIVRINPDDASSRNIKEDDYVYIENSRGHAVARARISSGIRPGVVKYPKGWQKYQFKTGCWGSLHNSEFDPVGVNSSYFDSICQVSLWDGKKGLDKDGVRGAQKAEVA